MFLGEPEDSETFPILYKNQQSCNFLARTKRYGSTVNVACPTGEERSGFGRGDACGTNSPILVLYLNYG